MKLKIIIACLLVWGVSLWGQRPNIVILLADDMRADVMGCTGDTIIKTPHLDQLAGDGVLFTNNFCTTSICAVSRASLLSGRYQRTHGINDFAKNFSAEAFSRTYPGLLRKNGYRTGFIGKYGVGNKMPETEFDYWKGFPGQGNYLGKEKHLTALMGDQALEFLKTNGKEKPFCLSVSFKSPHAQDAAPREFPPDPRDEALYRDVQLPRSFSAQSKYYDMQPSFVRNSEGRKRWEKRFSTEEEFQKNAKDYYRLVTGMDREVGRIMETLKELQVLDQTLIIFTSDNGFFMGERGLTDKWLMYEESIRTPLIVRPPKPGSFPQKGGAMTLNIDVAPTVLDYAGIEIPSTMDGKSLRPLVEGKEAKWRKDFFYEHHFTGSVQIPQSEGIRTEKWKYIRYLTSPLATEQLFNLEKDPQELVNLANHSDYQGRLSEMRRRWQNFWE